MRSPWEWKLPIWKESDAATHPRRALICLVAELLSNWRRVFRWPAVSPYRRQVPMRMSMDIVPGRSLTRLYFRFLRTKRSASKGLAGDLRFSNSDTGKIDIGGLWRADQALGSWSGFLVNVALAPHKQKRIRCSISYSVFTFLSGVHNAAILELVQFMDPEDIAIVYPSICG